MSYIGSFVVACVAPSGLPERLSSLNDLGPVQLDEQTTVLLFSRNGWINDQIQELASGTELPVLPTSQTHVLIASAESLRALVAGLKLFLERVRRNPLALPQSARDGADEADLKRCSTLAPMSVQQALSTLETARVRDEECETPETLVSLLWCMLHLAEHALANNLCLLCVRSP